MLLINRETLNSLSYILLRNSCIHPFVVNELIIYHPKLIQIDHRKFLCCAEYREQYG